MAEPFEPSRSWSAALASYWQDLVLAPAVLALSFLALLYLLGAVALVLLWERRPAFGQR